MNKSLDDINYNRLAEQIKDWGLELGFQQVGITDTELAKDEKYLLKWLDQAMHGEMGYMQRHGSKRSRPAELIPGGIISCFTDRWFCNCIYHGKNVGTTHCGDYHRLFTRRSCTNNSEEDFLKIIVCLYRLHFLYDFSGFSFNWTITYFIQTIKPVFTGSSLHDRQWPGASA